MTHRPIPADELRAMRERCEKAATGEWKYIDSDNVIITTDRSSHVPEIAEGFNHAYDAQFIAAARTDLPRLLDAYESALAEIERLRQALEEISQVGTRHDRDGDKWIEYMGEHHAECLNIAQKALGRW